jgi:hypothetical protein
MKLSAESNKQVNARLQSPAALTRLEPVINFPTGGAGSQFFSVPGARSDEYRESSSDERHRNEENWPQPFGFHPGTHVLGQNAACAKVNNRLWRGQRTVAGF